MIWTESCSINDCQVMNSRIHHKGFVNCPSSYHNIRKTVERIRMRNNEYILWSMNHSTITTALICLNFTISCVSANSSIFILVETFLASMMFLVSYTRLHNNHYVLTSFLNQYSILTIMIICFCCLKNLDIHKDISIDISVDSCLRHFHCINEQILQEW